MNFAQLAVEAIDRFGEYQSDYFEGQWFTNLQMLKRGQTLATKLQSLGVNSGDRVLVMMHSCMEVPNAFHAIARLGAVSIPIMPQLVAREVRYILENSGAHTAITSPQLAPVVAEASAGLEGFKQVLSFGDSSVDSCNIEDCFDTEEPLSSMADCSRDDLAVLVYTSGTTGNPKGVMLSHGNLIENARAVGQMFDLPPDYRTMMVLPMSHVYGILLMNMANLLGGASAMLPWFDTERALSTIQDFKVQRCSLVPAMMVAMLQHPNRDKYDYSTLERVNGGSAPLPEEVRLAFEAAFDCKVFDGYGQSEATCAVTAFKDGEEFVTGSCGAPVPGVEVCVQDDENNILPSGETGEICTRGPSVMLGYWNNEEATSKAIIDGWLHSGDIGHIDENGYVHITDRKKDLIIKGGENISPREIEEAICKLDGVVEASVYGVPDEKFQEEIAASVICSPSACVDESCVQQHVAQHVNKFKIPKYVEFPEQLPRNSNGKVLKRTLKDQWQSKGPMS